MKVTKRQLRRIIREAVGDQLPYNMGGPWVDKDAPVGKGAKEYDDLDTELTDKEIEDAMGWEPATGNDALSLEDIGSWLENQYEEYKKDKALTPGAIQMLLMDDFMDDLGAEYEMTPEIKSIIDDLAGVNGGRRR